MATIGTMTVNVVANTAGLSKGLARATSATRQASGRMGKLTGALSGSFTSVESAIFSITRAMGPWGLALGAGVGIATAAITTMNKKVEELEAGLLKMRDAAKKAGMSIEEFSKKQFPSLPAITSKQIKAAARSERLDQLTEQASLRNQSQGSTGWWQKNVSTPWKEAKLGAAYRGVPKWNVAEFVDNRRVGIALEERDRRMRAQQQQQAMFGSMFGAGRGIGQGLGQFKKAVPAVAEMMGTVMVDAAKKLAKENRTMQIQQYLGKQYQAYEMQKEFAENAKAARKEELQSYLTRQNKLYRLQQSLKPKQKPYEASPMLNTYVKGQQGTYAKLTQNLNRGNKVQEQQLETAKKSNSHLEQIAKTIGSTVGLAVI